MATKVREPRPTLKRSFSGQMAHELTSQIQMDAIEYEKDLRYSRGANKAAERVERLNDRAKAYAAATKPLTQRIEQLTPEYEQRAARAQKSGAAYAEAQKAYLAEYKRWKAGKPTMTYDQLVALYNRQKEGGALHANATNRYHQWQNIQRAYEGLRRHMQQAYAQAEAERKRAERAYKAYQKRYGDSTGRPVQAW